MRVLLAIPLLVWPAVAAAQLTIIEGRVVDDDSVAVKGATVAWSEDARVRTVLTDERGMFSVALPSRTPTHLAVTKAGFITQTAALSPDSTSPDIRLQRAAIATGIVRDPDGTPVFNASVRLQPVSAGDDGPSWTVKTDDRGEFRTLQLPPGRYRVNTTQTLMIDGVGSSSQVLSDPVTTNLPAGQHTRIALTHRQAAEPGRAMQTGAITGLVLDAAGEPAADITVRVFRGRKRGAFWELAPVAVAQRTDDEGRYRVFNLEPGRYVVQASDERPFISALAAKVDVPVYYPSAVAAPDALQLRVTEGLETSGIDIRLRREPYVRVSGTVVSASGPMGQTVLLTRLGPPGTFIEPMLVAELRGGTFEFPKVVPGEYTLQTDYQVTDQSPFVITATSDLEGVVVSTIPPRRMTGHVALEGQTANRSEFTLAFLPVDAAAMTDAASSSRGRVFILTDWSFHVTTGFGMGRFVLTKSPAGWFVRTVRAASLRPGDEPLEPADDAEITIVLARATGLIAGTIRTSGTRDHTLNVVAFSTDERLWYERSPHVLAVPADAAGRFVMPPMPAGEYYVVALDAADLDVAAGELLEPRLLQLLTRDASRVTVRDNARQQVVVSVSSAR